MECRADVVTMLPRRSLRRWILPLLLPLLAAACAKPPARPVRVGLIAWAGYEGMFLAERQSSAHGMPVQVIRYSAASEVIRALGAGQIEAGALTADEALLAASLHPRTGLRIAAVLDFSNGADAILVRPPLARLADLRGRRVGVEAGAVGGYLLSRALERAGLGVADVIPVSLAYYEHQDAWARGEVDAIVTFGEARARTAAAGGVTVFDSKEIPGEILDVLVVRADLNAAERTALGTLLAGWFRLRAPGMGWPDSVAAASQADLGITPTEYRQTSALLDQPDLERNRLLLAPGPAGLEPVLARIATALQAHRLAGPLPPPGSLLDPGLLPAAP